MDDKGDPRDEKDRLGLAASILRRPRYRSQKLAAQALGVDARRISALESGEAASPEQLAEFANALGYRSVHLLKAVHLVDFIWDASRRPLDPLGPTADQEVVIYEAIRELVAEFEAICHANIRRERLKEVLQAAEARWAEIRELAPSRRQDLVRESAELHTWELCLFLCEESVRQAADDPREAIEVGRLAVVAARGCAGLPWTERLEAFALAHLGNAWRVQGNHREADKLFAEARRLWSSPGAEKADPGVLDPGRILHMEAALRKDQRRLPEALALLDQAYDLGRDQGRVLVHRSLVLGLMGSYEAALATLRRADELLEDREPRDEFVLKINTGINLCHLEKYEEAAAFADSAFKIAEASENRIDGLRSRWLQARVLAGKGDRVVAAGIYKQLLYEFQELEMFYDLALLTLELSAILLCLGRSRECQSLTDKLPSYFEAKGIHQEALAALKVFSESVRLETATESLARQVVAFLYRSQGNQGLRFNQIKS